MPREFQPVTRNIALRTSAVFAVAIGVGLIITSVLSGWSVLFPAVAVPLVVAITFFTNYYTTRHRYGKSGTWTS